MLENVRVSVQNRHWYSNPERKKAQEEIEKKLGVEKLKKQIEEIDPKVQAELKMVDTRYEAENRKQLKYIALAIIALWSCDTADEAKKLIEKFVMAEFPDVAE